MGTASEVALVGGAAAVLLFARHDRPDVVGVLLFAALMLWAENAAVALHRMSISPGFMVAMAALTALDGRGAVLGMVLVGASGGLRLLHARRRAWRKIVFNCSLYGLSAAVAAAAYGVAGASFAAAIVLGGLAYAAANVVLLLPVITLVDGVPAGRILRDVVAALPSYLAFGVLGMGVGLTYVHHGTVAVLLLIAPLVVARSAYQALSRQRMAYDRLEKIHSLSSALVEATDTGSTARAAVTDIAAACAADEVLLLLVREDVVVRLSAAGDLITCDEVARTDLALDELALLATTEPSRADDGDSMSAPVVVDEDVRGAVLVRRPHNGPFGGDELQLLTTLVTQLRNALQRAQLLERLRHESLHDGLTGLANRTLFRRRLDDCLATGHPALLLVDIDGFKAVNDTLGHGHGDQLLVAIAARLLAVLPPTATVARLGGDEFAIVLPDHGVTATEHVAVELLRAIERPFSLAGLQFEVTGSIGISCSPRDGDDVTTLVHRADVALASAKARHTRWSAYVAEDDNFSPRRLALAGDLRRAIDEHQLRLHYQPLCDPRTGRIESVEALLRWRHPVHGELPPDEFIAVAEHTDLVHPLTRAVLTMALSQLAAWRRDGLDLRIAVNLSARSLLDPTLPARVGLALAGAGVPASALTLELTETAVMDDPERSIDVLRQLRTLGVHVAIDDFGTGYSSLAYLKHLPVDELKIDRSLISQLTGSTFDRRIVGSVIDLGRDLGLTVIAEGVEDEETATQLSELGCPLVQGYFFSRPVPAAEIVPLVLANDATSA